MTLFIIYEDVEYKGIMYDIRVEKFKNSITLTNVYENKTDNDITEDFNKETLNTLKRVLEFDLGM